MFDTENLIRKFGNLTLHIDKGEVFGFLGPNGAGKTATIRMLVCLIAPTSGSATVAGYNIQQDPSKCGSQSAYSPKIPAYTSG